MNTYYNVSEIKKNLKISSALITTFLYNSNSFKSIFPVLTNFSSNSRSVFLCSSGALVSIPFFKSIALAQ